MIKLNHQWGIFIKTEKNDTKLKMMIKSQKNVQSYH